MNILIVDDNKDIRNALAETLGEHMADAQIHTASNGKMGEEILNTESIDLVLTDLDMPVADGFSLIEFMKKNFPDLPLCVMTGFCEPSVKERLRLLGVTRWIEKPFQFDELATLMTSLITKKGDD